MLHIRQATSPRSHSKKMTSRGDGTYGQDMQRSAKLLRQSRKETRQALRSWIDQPKTLLRWLLLAMGVGVLILLAALGVAALASPSDDAFYPTFTDSSAGWNNAIWVVKRGLLVLCLHCLVCLAAYLAMRAVPAEAEHTTGINRWIHEHVGPVAMFAVAACTVFSLLVQAWHLGLDITDASRTLDVSPGLLVLAMLPHSLLAFGGMFLPLAACLSLGRAGEWNKALAAALLAGLVGAILVFVGAGWEIWIAPHLLPFSTWG